MNTDDTTQPRREFLKGIQTGLPVAVGYVPIAIAFGTLATKVHLSTLEAVLMSTLVFAGASQFMAASMMLAGADGLQIVIATLFINLRHLVMSMAVHHTVRKTSRAWRALLSFGITDETFALLTLQDTQTQAPPTHFFATGLIGIAYAGWVAGTAVGSIAAQVIPPSVSVSMTVGLYAMFIGLLIPHARRSARVALIALVSMALNAALTTFMSMGWAIVVSTILGASFGLLLREPAP